MSSILLTACQSNTKTEFTIDEFGELYKKTHELFNEEGKYLTDEEKNNEEGRKLFQKCSKKTGLPYNTEITLRGVKKTFAGGLSIESEDEKYTIYCKFPSEPNNNIGLFVEDGKNVVVAGIFSKEDGPYGMLSDTEFISPSEINIEYKATDINEVLAEIDNEYISVDKVIQGEIFSIMSLEEFKDQFDEFIDFDKRFFSDTVARIDGTDGGTIYFSYNENIIGKLSAGDRVAIQGDVYSITGFKNSSQKYISIGGYINTVYDCYNFDLKN